MFSPAKAIATGAVVFAIGGALLIAQPFEQPGGAPGAVQRAEPVHVMGTVAPGPCPGQEVNEELDGVSTFRGGYCHPRWFLDDERLGGRVTWAWDNDDFLDDSELSVGILAVAIEDELGAWRMPPEVMFETPDMETLALPSQFVLVGSGAYEGLYAVLAYDGSRVDGYIVEGAPPPVPEVLAGG